MILRTERRQITYRKTIRPPAEVSAVKRQWYSTFEVLRQNNHTKWGGDQVSLPPLYSCPTADIIYQKIFVLSLCVHIHADFLASLVCSNDLFIYFCSNTTLSSSPKLYNSCYSATTVRVITSIRTREALDTHTSGWHGDSKALISASL